MDRYIAHQVSQAHTSAMCRTVGIDPIRVPVTFPTRGNMGPATIPFTLATQLDSLRGRRSGAAHGRRFRHERRLHGGGLVTGRRPHPAASKPPAGLPGLDPNWSRLVTATDDDGVERTWHVLDNGAEATIGTMLCVHGNPTWSYLWRRFLAEAARGVAGGRRRPARDGLLRAPGAPPARSRSGSPTSRP